jgi:hypothetical protein
VNATLEPIFKGTQSTPTRQHLRFNNNIFSGCRSVNSKNKTIKIKWVFGSKKIPLAKKSKKRTLVMERSVEDMFHLLRGFGNVTFRRLNPMRRHEFHANIFMDIQKALLL